ncbi:unnamed protein product [Arabis nemorensis]|uniref:Alanyl-tRNA synthetase class IIc N-terminal domain-containing protein n=1 Tax=Arabis nemorensis TaxID=586526 RepID=A0A565B333_9BRAS|nr:unnamed protein product [Arabis nemorensis]
MSSGSDRGRHGEALQTSRAIRRDGGDDEKNDDWLQERDWIKSGSVEANVLKEEFKDSSSNIKNIKERVVTMSRGIFFIEQFALEGFFSRLVHSVTLVMGDVFPELKEHEKKITEIIEEEEAAFCETLEKFAFDLWTTHGFPLDFTQLLRDNLTLRTSDLPKEGSLFGGGLQCLRILLI